MLNLRSRPPRFLNQAFLSLLDQAWLSALNLCLGLILIRLASKEAYGVYSQLFAAGLFSTTVLEALVFNPMVNVCSGQTDEQRAAALQNLARYQQRISSALALILGLSCTWISWQAGQSAAWALGLTFALFVKLNAKREYVRSMAFLDARADKVLRIDGSYGLLILLGMAALLVFQSLDVASIFAVFALANLGGLLAVHTPLFGHHLVRPDYRVTIQQAWQRGRLSLPGAVLAWIVNYSYLYLAALWLGAIAAAELSASRLLLMPVSLCAVAWFRVAWPEIGKLSVAQRFQQLNRLLAYSIVALLALALLYILMLWLSFPWLNHYLLTGKYEAAEPLLLWWGAYFMVYAVRWVGSAALMGQDAYAFMLLESVLSFVVVFAALALLMPRFGLPGAVFALIVVELFSLFMTWGKYIYQARNHNGVSPQ